MLMYLNHVLGKDMLPLFWFIGDFLLFFIAESSELMEKKHVSEFSYMLIKRHQTNGTAVV